jgi:hypothetical protein
MGNGRNSPVIGNNGVQTKPGDNKRYADALLEIAQWGTVDRSDIDALESRFWKYVEYCSKHDLRVTNKVAYFSMGITKDDVYDWENGRSRGTTHSDFIKKVKGFCAAYREMLGVDGKINPITLVWWQKNYDGMVDKHEIEVHSKSAIDELPLDEIERRIPKNIPVDADYSEQ